MTCASACWADPLWMPTRSCVLTSGTASPFPSSQNLAVSTGMAEGSARLAVPAARGIPRRDHRHHYPHGVVHHAERTARGACQSEPDDEPGESAVVLPRVAGNAGVLRPVDCRRGDADAHHHRLDGDSLY